MPRYRTISCDYCGFMQLKRDRECERCGRMTRRERRRWAARSIPIAFALILALVLYAKAKGFIPV